MHSSTVSVDVIRTIIGSAVAVDIRYLGCISHNREGNPG
jgi:hypothetical protein